MIEEIAATAAAKMEVNVALSNREYWRGVYDFLRDVYGVKASDITETGAGKHVKVRFPYRGKTMAVTLSSSPGDRNAVALKKRDLRNLLGNPPVTTPAIKRTLDELTAEVASAAKNGAPVEPTGYTGNVSLRASNRTLWFSVPIALIEAYDAARGGPSLRGVRVRTLPNNAWAIRADAVDRPAVRRVGHAGEIAVGARELLDRLGGFAATPARMRLANGEILVELAEAPRKAAIRGAAPVRRSVSEPMPATAAPVVPEPEASPESLIPIGVPSEPTEEPMIARPTVIADVVAVMSPTQVLTAIRNVEATTEYRLIKRRNDDGTHAWVFRHRAPVIE